MEQQKMKKVFALVLSAIMAWGFVGCGVNPEDRYSASNSSIESQISSKESNGGSSLENSEDSSSKNSGDSSSKKPWWDIFGDSSESSSSDSSEDSSESSSSSSSSSDSSEDSSSDDETPIQPSVVPYDGSQVTITFYHTMGAALRGVLNQYIPKFNEKYPNITVTHSTMGDYVGLRDQILMELVSGRSPSLAYCYPDHVALYNKANVVLPLDDYIANTELATTADGSTEVMGMTQAQLDDFIPGFFEEGKMAYADGVTYSLPMTRSTEVLYYNKTFFEQYNLTVPTTWDEMELVCAQIKAIDSNCIPLGYDNEANWFITMAQQLGEPYTAASGDSHFLFNTEKNRAAVERATEWYQKGYVTTLETYGSYTSDLFTRTESSRMKSYMCIGSSAGASYQCPDRDYNGNYPFEVGVAMIPQANPEKPAVIQQGPSLCLFKTSPQEQAAAWLFAEYLSTCTEFQGEFSLTSGYTPVIKSAIEHPVYEDFLSKASEGNDYLQARVIAQTIAQMDAYFYSPAFNGSVAARDEVTWLVVGCLTQAPKDGAAEYIKSRFESTIDYLRYDYD